MSRAVVAGEALVDLVIDPGGAVVAKLGGAPFNTARAAARLGADVAFLGPLSTDRFGTQLRDALVSDGVTVLGPQTQRPTTLAAAELDVDGAASYRFYIDGTSAPDLTVTPDLAAAPDRAAAPGNVPPDVLFTGGLGLVLEPMATTLSELVLAASADTLVMIDVNCRPKVIHDRAAYLDRIDSLLARVDIVKVSDDDLAYLAPDLAPEIAAASLLERGASAVLITAGAARTTILVRAERIDVPVPPLSAPVVDTIGAGDTFGGALIAWWAEAGLGRIDIGLDTLAGAVRAAHAAAAVVVTRRGADPPWRAELPDDWAGHTR